jgi:hypothetical protein
MDISLIPPETISGKIETILRNIWEEIKSNDCFFLQNMTKT